MPRRPRELNETGVFHTFGRVFRPATRPFSNSSLAARFVSVLREAIDRFRIGVYAWVLLPSCFHMVLRVEGVAVGRVMAFVRREVARWHNATRGSRGSFWGERYAVARLRRRGELRQAVVFVHTRPVVEGVGALHSYPWSGHQQLASGAPGLAAIPHTLALFGRTTREARAAYLAATQSTPLAWLRVPVSRLPWWREREKAPVRPTGLPPSPLYPGRCPVSAFVEWGSAVLGIESSSLTSRRRGKGVTVAREVLLLVGVSVLRLRVGELAQAVGVSLTAGSRALARAERKERGDDAFAARVARLRHLLLVKPVEERGRPRDLQTHLGASPDPWEAGGMGPTPVHGDLTGGRGELGDGTWRGDIFVDPTPVSNGSVLAGPMAEG